MLALKQGGAAKKLSLLAFSASRRVDAGEYAALRLAAVAQI
jgi:hypothetical protein